MEQPVARLNINSARKISQHFTFYENNKLVLLSVLCIIRDASITCKNNAAQVLAEFLLACFVSLIYKLKSIVYDCEYRARRK